MAIETDKYLEYDDKQHFYYLTELGMIEYTGYTELVDLWGDAQRRLKLQGRLLHQEYIKSAYNGNLVRYRHRDIIEYNVYRNLFGERQAIIDALINFVEVVYDTELDREILSGDKTFTNSILQPLKDAKVLYRGEYRTYVPEDEYEEGY